MSHGGMLVSLHFQSAWVRKAECVPQEAQMEVAKKLGWEVRNKQYIEAVRSCKIVGTHMVDCCKLPIHTFPKQAPCFFLL